MKKKGYIALLALIGLLLPLLSACATTASDQETMYQVSTISALSQGDYYANTTVGDLKKEGDFGLGTFTALDGELIALDGVVYHAKSDGTVAVAGDSDGVPFATVTGFQSDFDKKDMAAVGDTAAMEKLLDAAIQSNTKDLNCFYAVKVTGEWNSITVRACPPQEEPYPSLTDAVKTQKSYTHQNIKGTLVAIYSPTAVGTVNQAGWHFHFISDDHQVGGHVQALDLKTGDAAFDTTADWLVTFPENDSFSKLSL